jgi:hypothetical protein
MEEKNDWTVDGTVEEEKKNIRLGDIYCCTNEFNFESYEINSSSECRVSFFTNNKIILPLELKFLNEVIFMVSYEFKEKPVDKSNLKYIIIDAVNSKDKENAIRITSTDLNFEIPKTFKSLHRFSEFHVGFNKFDQTFMVYLYLYNNIYIIKLNLLKKKFEVLYEKKLASSPNSNSSLMLNYLINNEDSRVFLYNKPNLIILTYNYFKNLNYEEKLLNLETINDKIKNIYVSNFDLKNVFIITNLSSLFYFDYKSNKMSKVEDKYKFLCEKIHLISNLTSDDPSTGNFQYFITDHRDKEKKAFYLKLWRMNLNIDICEKTNMIKIEFIQQIQFDYSKNHDFDYRFKIRDRKILLNFYDHDKLFILNIAEHDKYFVIEKLYQFSSEKCNFTITNSDFNLIVKPEGVSLNLFTYFNNEMIFLSYNQVTEAKYHNFIKCLSPSDFKKETKSVENVIKSEKNKKNEVVNAFNTNKKESSNNINSEKTAIEIKLPEKKSEENKKTENKRKNLPLSLNDDPKPAKEELIIEKNFPNKNESKNKEDKNGKKDKQGSIKEKQNCKREDGSGSFKKAKKTEKIEIERPQSNDLKEKEVVVVNVKKEYKNELFDLNEIKLLIENKIKPSIENKIKEDIDQILDKNLSVFSENINKKFSEILTIFNREKETLENRKKINLELLENISKLVIKNTQNQPSNPSSVQNDQIVNQQSSIETKNESLKQNNQIPIQINNQKTPNSTSNHNLNPSSLNTNIINSSLYNQSLMNNTQPNLNNYTNLPLTNNNVNSSQMDMNLLLYYLNNQHRALQQQLSLNSQILTSFQQSQGMNINPFVHPPNYNMATPNNPMINQFQQQNSRSYNQNIPSNLSYMPPNFNNNNNSFNPFYNTPNFNSFNSANQNQSFSNPFNNFQFTNPNPNIIGPQSQFPQGINVSQNPMVQSLNQPSPKKFSSNHTNPNLVNSKIKELEKISLDIESEEDDLSPEEEEKFINMIKEDLKTKARKKKSGNSQINSTSSHGRLRSKKPKKK